MPSFNKAVKIADGIENSVKELFSECGFNLSKVPHSERSFYDLYCDEFSIEVKYDMMASFTGNVAFEYYNTKQKKASGINITKATFWLHVVRENKALQFHIINTDVLKGLLAELSNDNMARKVAGGDDNSEMLLVKKEYILKDFTNLELLTEMDRHQWIMKNL